VDDTKFKKYLQLRQEKKLRDNKWSHDEDMNLLRGYQTYGERWSLIRIFFTPNRKRSQIKQRWLTLIKSWKTTNSKGKNDLQQASSFLARTREDELPAALKIFLNFLNASTYNKYTAALSRASKEEANQSKDAGDNNDNDKANKGDDNNDNNDDDNNNDNNDKNQAVSQAKQPIDSMARQTNAIIHNSQFEQDSLDDDSDMDDDNAKSDRDSDINAKKVDEDKAQEMTRDRQFFQQQMNLSNASTSLKSILIESKQPTKISPFNPLWSIYDSPNTPRPITLDIKIPSSSIKGNNGISSIPITVQLASSTQYTCSNDDNDNNFYDGIDDFDSQQKKQKVN